MKKIPILIDLYVSLAKIGSVTFGGGMAMMPILQRELIEKKKWMTEDELLDYYAIGQSTPGIIAVNVATFVGFKQAGIAGGIAATLGMVTPSVVIISLIARFISSVDHLPLAQKALRGINVSVAALLTSVVFQFSKKTVKSILGFLCLAVSFAAIWFFKVPSYWMIIAGAATGVIVSVLSRKKEFASSASGTTETSGAFSDKTKSNDSEKTESGMEDK